MKQILKVLLIVIAIFTINTVFAQDDNKDTSASESQSEVAAALAKAAANPIANMISLPFQFNFNFNQGPLDRFGTVMNFQPVLPFRLSKKWNVVTRTIIPITQKPDILSTEGSTSGIGNTNFNAFFVPPMIGIFTYGFGITMNIPTASAPELGGDAFGIGPTIIFLFMPGKMVLGATSGLIKAYKSPDGKDALNSFFTQYFITYNMKKGWFINTSPTITANFNAIEGEEWTVPIGAGFGKLQHFNNLPVKFNLQYYFNVAQASRTPGTEFIDLAHDPRQAMGNADQSLVFTATFIFPHKKSK